MTAAKATHSTDKKIALVTGANRGIGMEVCRQLAKKDFRLLLGSRDPKKGEAAAEKLRAEGLDVQALALDVTKDAEVDRAFREIESRYGRLDVLVNNAGVFLDSTDEGTNSVFQAPVSLLKETLETNTFGAFRLSQRFIPLMRKNGYGRVVNISSGMGQLSEMNGGWPAYRVSKTALNALTRIFSEEAGHPDVKVNSVCPGWVKTDMGGPEAERPVEEGAKGVVWAATLPSDGPTGGFFRDGERIDW